MKRKALAYCKIRTRSRISRNTKAFTDDLYFKIMTEQISKLLAFLTNLWKYIHLH